ncbi:MAG: M23 family metallopeptidase [Proteobacteria bacterium]|nr:M23 family metallopeptidase [Pseudomonadota bacterium]
MELLIISKSRGTAARIRLGWVTVAVCAAVIIATTGYSAYWGYARGSDDMAELILSDPERSAEIWQREIISQRQFLNGLERDIEADLSALASTVGKLQGHVTRLDAVAERVITTTNLDPVEFDFANAPGVGGPESAHSNSPQWAALLKNLDALKDEIRLRDSRLTTLESLLLDMQLRDNMQPEGRPVNDGWISSGYGYRNDPVTGRKEFHAGVDFAGKLGVKVRAVAAGVVTWSGRRWGYGNMVELNHGNGTITRYAHNRANLVSLGDKVEKNQAVALLGSTGRSTGPHVHFEVVRNDRTVNPWKFIRKYSAD